MERKNVFDRLSTPPSHSHLLVPCKLLLQLSVFVVPHQIVDRITTLLRSFLSRNHPRIIVCLSLLFLHCGSQEYFVTDLRYTINPIILHRR